MSPTGRSLAIETRTPERVRAHYLIERELADRLRVAPTAERQALYGEVYEELFQRVPDHPQLGSMATSEGREERVRTQLPPLELFLGSARTFLEIGAGDCALSISIAPRLEHVYALDVSETITAPARGVENITVVISDGSSIPVPRGSVDLAYSNQLIEHLHAEDALTQLRNVVPALSARGRYLVVTPHRFTGPHDVSHNFTDVATGFHLVEYTGIDLARVMRQAGFDRVTALIGARGRYVEVPVAVVATVERAIGWLPVKIRRRAAESFLLRPLFGLRLVGRKRPH